MRKPVIAITMGDAAGIGPEVALKALADEKIRRLASFVLVGDAGIIRPSRRRTKSAPDFRVVKKFDREMSCRPGVYLLDLGNLAGKKFRTGRVSKVCGRAAIEYIETAVRLARMGAVDAIVTAPISKEAAKLAGFKFPGHTEFLAHLSGTRDFAMMLAGVPGAAMVPGGPLRVVLVTTHLALKDVGARLNKKEILRVIRLTRRSLRDWFGIRRPRLAVCALNPHAGEGSAFGDEEKRIIAPAVAAARREGNGKIEGPLAADALFYRAYRGDFDAVVVMYHDQGLIPLKMIAFDRGVNVTLGLPFVRTSPDHGTGFDIAGKGIARPESMKEAIRLAATLACRRGRRRAGKT